MTKRKCGSCVFIYIANALWIDLIKMFNGTLICIVINAQRDCIFQMCIFQKVP